MALYLLAKKGKKNVKRGFSLSLPYENLKGMTSERDVRLRATIQFCDALEKHAHANLYKRCR